MRLYRPLSTFYWLSSARLFFSPLVFSSLLLAQLPPSHAKSNSTGVTFFRTPQSLFSSGESSLSNLRKKLVGHESLYTYLIDSNHRKQWVPARMLARDIDLSFEVTYKNKTYTLLETHNSWALLASNDNSTNIDNNYQKQWAPLFELRPSEKDLGLALTLIPTSLRAGPSWSSELIKTLNAKSRLHILEVQDSWIKVEVQIPENQIIKNYVGFVDINNVMIKADFADHVLDQKNTWQKVLYREGNRLLLENKKTLAIENVQAWKTRADLGLLIESNEDKKLLLRQSATILKTESQIWGISELKDHGKVYWRITDNEGNSLLSQGKTLEKEQILAREVFSVAWDSRNPKIGLVSAHGIFSTLDGGETWVYHENFQDQDHAVNIGQDGTWYVGVERSRDQGKSFRHYVRLEEIARLIQSQIHHPPRSLRLSKIDFQNERMEILVDAGVKKVRLATKSKAEVISNWDFL